MVRYEVGLGKADKMLEQWARNVAISYRDTIDAAYRGYRQRHPGRPIACKLFDLRHDYAVREAVRAYPKAAQAIADLCERAQAAPGRIPGYWEVAEMSSAVMAGTVAGHWPVYVIGPTIVVIQLPIPPTEN
jgi:hypothetical protein